MYTYRYRGDGGYGEIILWQNRYHIYNEIILSVSKGLSSLPIYMGLRLKNNGVNWYFQDLVQAKFGHPIYGIYGFSILEVFIQLYELKPLLQSNLAL